MLCARFHILGRPQYAALRVAPFLLLTGCGTFRPFSGVGQSVKNATESAASAMPGLGMFGVLAFICMAAGVAIVVCSFIPFLSTFVPRKAAVAAIACGVGVHLIQAFLAKFQTLILWGSLGLIVVGGGLLLWPFIIAAYRGTLFRKSKELMKAGETRAAAAFEIAATPNAAKSGQVRKAILAKLEAKVHPAPEV